MKRSKSYTEKTIAGAAALYNWIVEYKRLTGDLPSLIEIQKRLNKSVPAVHYYLTIIESGLVTGQPMTRDSLRRRERPGIATGDKIAAKVFDFIVKYKARNDGNSPSIDEIIAAVGLSSKSMADYYLRRLESSGKIRRSRSAGARGNARSIRVVGSTWIAPPGVMP